MEAKVASWRDEKCLEKISFRQRVDLSGDVQSSPGDRDCSAKAKQSVEVEGSDLGVVSLKVGEVEVVGQSLLGTREPHGLEKRLAPVLKLDDQLQLGSPLLLADPHDGQALHRGDRVPDCLPIGGVHLLLGRTKLKLEMFIWRVNLGHTKLELLPNTLSRDLAALR